LKEKKDIRFIHLIGNKIEFFFYKILKTNKLSNNKLCTLDINNDVRSVFRLTNDVSSFPHFSFSPSPLKTLSFFATHQTCLRETTISDSFIVGSSWNLSTTFATHFQAFSPLGILISCLIWEKYLSHCSLFFSCRNPKWSQ